MYEQRCSQPSNTNSTNDIYASFLFFLLTRQPKAVKTDIMFRKKQKTFLSHLGVYNAWGTPVSIPNTEVKSRRAYGTSVRSGGRVGRRQDAIFEDNEHTRMKAKQEIQHPNIWISMEDKRYKTKK